MDDHTIRIYQDFLAALKKVRQRQGNILVEGTTRVDDEIKRVETHIRRLRLGCTMKGKK